MTKRDGHNREKADNAEEEREKERERERERWAGRTDEQKETAV
jgi:hypothetical protein